uniref:Uncharacterized protein n=1 Tax=Bionectria ochroleuca TaxID=29856 RepID=A0A8H7K4J1_BIOOC
MISKPKVSTSNPKLAGFAKPINIDEVNKLDVNKLNSLSAEQLVALYNFGQDILGRMPEDELDAQVISALRSQGLDWFQFLVAKAESFQQNAVNEKNK